MSLRIVLWSGAAAFKTTFREVSSGQGRFRQLSASESGQSKVGPTQIGTPQIASRENCASKIHALEVGLTPVLYSLIPVRDAQGETVRTNGAAQVAILDKVTNDLCDVLAKLFGLII